MRRGRDGRLREKAGDPMEIEWATVCRGVRNGSPNGRPEILDPLRAGNQIDGPLPVEVKVCVATVLRATFTEVKTGGMVSLGYDVRGPDGPQNRRRGDYPVPDPPPSDYPDLPR